MNWLTKIFEAISKFFSGVAGVEKKFNPLPRAFRNQRLLAFASGEIGVYEWKNGSNPKVEIYLDHGSSLSNKKSNLKDNVPWCAGFIAYCLEMVGMGSTNKLNARSYLKWGVSVKHDPVPGDIAVFWRGSRNGWKGHVAIYLGHNRYLGGNQNDQVNVSLYKTKLLDIRRSSLHKDLTREDRILLMKMAEEIIAGNQVSLSGKVV